MAAEAKLQPGWLARDVNNASAKVRAWASDETKGDQRVRETKEQSRGTDQSAGQKD